MEFDLWWLLILPLMFALGWLAARVDLRQVGKERALRRDAPQAYYRGLNHLLNEQQDKAIDAFIEAVQNDPETADLHFALGNLFRRRGEYHRAVRVHEHLLSRADLGKDDRERAQHGLAQDFLKAGLLDRAEEALRRLEGTAYEAEARLALLHHFGVNRGLLSLERWVQVCSTNAARWMGLAHKGRVAPGYDADIVIFDPRREYTIAPATLREAAGWTPYDGLTVTGWPRTVLLRGKVIVDSDLYLGKSVQGRFVWRSF